MNSSVTVVLLFTAIRIYKERISKFAIFFSYWWESGKNVVKFLWHKWNAVVRQEQCRVLCPWAAGHVAQHKHAFAVTGGQKLQNDCTSTAIPARQKLPLFEQWWWRARTLPRFQSWLASQPQSKSERLSIMFVISFWSWQPQRRNWSSLHSRLWNNCFLLRLRRPQRRSNSDTKSWLQLSHTSAWHWKCWDWGLPQPLQAAHTASQREPGAAPRAPSAASRESLTPCWHQLEEYHELSYPGFCFQQGKAENNTTFSSSAGLNEHSRIKAFVEVFKGHFSF